MSTPQDTHTVRWRVRELAESAGYANPHALALAARVSVGAVRGIWNDTATRADLDTIGKLADTLDCQIGDLFEYRQA
jgi:DNA-binding Xre family transcriptional regulator